MADKVAAVLEAYHKRMREERQGRRGTPRRSHESWHNDPLLAVGPETGWLLDVVARSLPVPRVLELGTSFGYLTIWLAEGARPLGGSRPWRCTPTSRPMHGRWRAGLAGHVEFLVGDAVQLLIPDLPGPFDLVLMNLWKDLYVPCLQAFAPKLAPGAIVVADNMLRPGGPQAAAYQAAVRAIPGMTSVLLPVGTDIEVSRREEA